MNKKKSKKVTKLSKKQNAKKIKLKIKYRSFLTLIAILASFFLIYNIYLLGPIEPLLRIIVIFIILFIDLYFIRKNNSSKNKNLYIMLMILFITINFSIGMGLNKVYSLINNLNKANITYSTSLITKTENEINEIDDIVNKKIGLLNDPTSVDNYTLAKEIIENNQLKEDNEIVLYEDLTNMLHDLYQNNIDCIFISSNYPTMFQTIDEYQNISQQTKIITTSEKSVKKEDSIDYVKSDGKNITKPFTILLMGVDSESDGLIKNASNGDSLILISFNPKTLNATMLSIPRDSYVPISCFKEQRESKITHAGWYGASCMLSTIENIVGVKVDYYLKINFKGVVSLVNTLGGVTVDVPKDLCTDNSSRTGQVCIEKGIQTLDGEGALVLARNRYDLARGDLDRANNQQLLLKAMLNQAKNINSISHLENILKTISNNIDTNMTTSQILSLYNIAKDIFTVGRNNGENIISIQKLSLAGEGQMIYDEGAKLTLWNYILNKESIKDVEVAIKENLETAKLITNFDYSVNDFYQSKIVGNGPYKTKNTYTLLPNFIGENISNVEQFAKKNNIKVEYNYENNNSSIYKNGDIIYQNYPKNSRIDKIKTLKVTVLKKSTNNQKLDCTSTENKNKECFLPSFIGKTKGETESYFNQYKNNINIIYNEVPISLYPGRKLGTVVGQNYKVSTHLSKIKTIEFTIIGE